MLPQLKNKMLMALIASLLVTSAITFIVLTLVLGTTEKYDEPKSVKPVGKLLTFFNLDDGIDLRFAHAVNSQAKLKSSLEDQSIMVLEADVLNDPVKNTPIMAHPPATTSDLTLKMFLQRVLTSKPLKGIKLDFKQLKVVRPSLEILKEFKESAKQKDLEIPPIFLNADILAGPNSPKATPVNATSFIDICNSYSSWEIISPGWTTRASKGSIVEGYSWDMVREMQALLKDVHHAVSFPVRASLVARSKEQLLWLLGLKKNYSLNLWHSNVDIYSMDGLAFLRIYPSRVYYDLPSEKILELRNLKH